MSTAPARSNGTAGWAGTKAAKRKNKQSGMRVWKHLTDDEWVSITVPTPPTPPPTKNPTSSPTDVPSAILAAAVPTPSPLKSFPGNGNRWSEIAASRIHATHRPRPVYGAMSSASTYVSDFGYLGAAMPQPSPPPTLAPTTATTTPSAAPSPSDRPTLLPTRPPTVALRHKQPDRLAELVVVPILPQCNMRASRRLWCFWRNGLCASGACAKHVQDAWNQWGGEGAGGGGVVGASGARDGAAGVATSAGTKAAAAATAAVSRFYTGTEPPAELGAMKCKHGNVTLDGAAFWCIHIVLRTKVPLSGFQFQLDMCPPPPAGGDDVLRSRATDGVAGVPVPMSMCTAGLGATHAKGGLADHAGMKLHVQPTKHPSDPSCCSFRVIGTQLARPLPIVLNAQLLTQILLPLPSDAAPSSSAHTNSELLEFLPPTPMPLGTQEASFIPRISHAGVNIGQKAA
jgi:hypothetical protein